MEEQSRQLQRSQEFKQKDTKQLAAALHTDEPAAHPKSEDMQE